jgi:hypothetical protein
VAGVAPEMQLVVVISSAALPKLRFSTEVTELTQQHATEPILRLLTGVEKTRSGDKLRRRGDGEVLKKRSERRSQTLVEGGWKVELIHRTSVSDTGTQKRRSAENLFMEMKISRN